MLLGPSILLSPNVFNPIGPERLLGADVSEGILFQKIPKIPKNSKWFQKIPNDSRKFQKIPNDSRKFKKIKK